MRVLVTNDDGIAAPGIEVAESIARQVAGADGEVWTVAPEADRSGVSHSLTYTSVVALHELTERRYATTGTPTDCVILGTEVVMAKTPPDLVLSGVNYGRNVAEDTGVSGTVGGALEAAMRLIRGIALSQSYGPKCDPEDPWASALEHGAEVVNRILSHSYPKNLGFNVNFPAVPRGQTKGIRLARLGSRGGSPMRPKEAESPRSRGRYFWLAYDPLDLGEADDTDLALCAQGWITVTPIHNDLTAHDWMGEETAKAIES